ncbi:MAG TPA: hypothetical protein DCR40_08765 [Prolixibacteraceae bacterium]|nr:hypothetical protein [Prolixibacteraceae bacterium]
MLLISLLGLSGISQMLLFLGIGLILFGWIEKKDKLILGGQIMFLILGFFALWILLSHTITIPQTISDKISKESRIIGFFRSSLLLMGITVVSFLMSLFKLRFQKVSVSIVLIIALMLFFMIVSIQQIAN